MRFGTLSDATLRWAIAIAAVSAFLIALGVQTVWADGTAPAASTGAARAISADRPAAAGAPSADIRLTGVAVPALRLPPRHKPHRAAHRSVHRVVSAPLVVATPDPQPATPAPAVAVAPPPPVAPARPPAKAKAPAHGPAFDSAG